LTTIDDSPTFATPLRPGTESSLATAAWGDDLDGLDALSVSEKSGGMG